MANNISNIKDVGSIISKMAAAMLEDNVQFLKTVEKEPESVWQGTNGYNAGDTININKPARFTLGTGNDITSSIQDVVEERVPLALTNQRNIPISLDSAEIATDLALKSWAKRILEPMMSNMAQTIEAECLALAQDAVGNVVGTPGSTAFDTATMAAARAKLRKNLAPIGYEEYALLNSDAMASAIDARKGLFQSSEEISKQYKKGYIGSADGFTYLENNLLPTHTNGNDVTGVAVNGATLEGATTLNVNGLTVTTGTVAKGSTFTIANVFRVHPITKDVTAGLQEFVVTEDATANGAGEATLSISPAIYAGSNGLQNVSALPVDTAALTFTGTADQSFISNMVYCGKAFRFASVPLVTPGGTDMASTSTVNGFTVRVVRDYDINTDRLIMRADVLYGFTTVRPEWAVRVVA